MRTQLCSIIDAINDYVIDWIGGRKSVRALRTIVLPGKVSRTRIKYDWMLNFLIEETLVKWKKIFELFPLNELVFGRKSAHNGCLRSKPTVVKARRWLISEGYVSAAHLMLKGRSCGMLMAPRLLRLVDEGWIDGDKKGFDLLIHLDVMLEIMNGMKFDLSGRRPNWKKVETMFSTIDDALKAAEQKIEAGKIKRQRRLAKKRGRPPSTFVGKVCRLIDALPPEKRLKPVLTGKFRGQAKNFLNLYFDGNEQEAIDFVSEVLTNWHIYSKRAQASMSYEMRTAISTLPNLENLFTYAKVFRKVVAEWQDMQRQSAEARRRARLRDAERRREEEKRRKSLLTVSDEDKFYWQLVDPEKWRRHEEREQDKIFEEMYRREYIDMAGPTDEEFWASFPESDEVSDNESQAGASGEDDTSWVGMSWIQLDSKCSQ